MSDSLEIYVLKQVSPSEQPIEDLIPPTAEIIEQKKYVDDSDSLISESVQCWLNSIDCQFYQYYESNKSPTPHVPPSSLHLSLSIDGIYLRNHTIEAANTDTGQPQEIKLEETIGTVLEALEYIVDKAEPELIVGDVDAVFDDIPVKSVRNMNELYWMNVVPVENFDSDLPSLEEKGAWRDERIGEYRWIVLSPDPTKSDQNRNIADDLYKYII